MANNNENTGKDRKSEAQEIFEQADNAGRFAGDDADAQAAKNQAVENIRQDTSADQQQRDDNDDQRRPEQIRDFEGDAQNITDYDGRPLNEEELNHARSKATEGQRQNRDV